MDFITMVKLAAIQTLKESLDPDVYNVIMDEAEQVLESGATADYGEAIKFSASNRLDEASYDLVVSVIDEATKVGTIGKYSAKGAVNGAIKLGVTDAVLGATSLNRNVREAKKELSAAQHTGNAKKIEAAKKKLTEARLRGAKNGAISGAVIGGTLGAGGGAQTGAEQYKKTHTGPNGEEIIDVKNYNESAQQFLNDGAVKELKTALDGDAKTTKTSSQALIAAVKKRAKDIIADDKHRNGTKQPLTEKDFIGESTAVMSAIWGNGEE